MKVGHLIHLDGAGGGPEAVVNLIRGLHDHGIDQVVFHGGTGRISALCDELKIARVRLAIDRKSTLFFGFIGLLLALKRTRPDGVLLHGQWAGPIGAIAASWIGVKTIYITHWPAFYTDWNPFRAWQNAWAEWIPCRLAKRVIALTPSVYYQYLHRYGEGDDKLVLMPNVIRISGIPTNEEAERIRREHGWLADFVHVVSVGRLADQKRVDWLLKAWREVQGNGRQARLWIVGDGPEKAALEKLSIQLGITGSCTFLGARPNGIVYMAAADIVVMTSLYESFGYVPWEAKACGKPLIANAVDGVRDNVQDGVDGFLVAPNDSIGLAEKIITVIDSPELRHQLGAAGAETMARMDPRDAITGYLRLINEVLDS